MESTEDTGMSFSMRPFLVSVVTRIQLPSKSSMVQTALNRSKSASSSKKDSFTCRPRASCSSLLMPPTARPEATSAGMSSFSR